MVDSMRAGPAADRQSGLASRRQLPHSLRRLRRLLTALVVTATVLGTASCGSPAGVTAAPGPAGPAARAPGAEEPGSQAPGSGLPAPSAPAQLPDATSPRSVRAGPLGPDGAWSLAWRDEFSGRSVDLDRWRPNWLADTDTAVTKPINRAEQSCYDPANATVKNGTLRLKAERRPCRTHDGRSYDYTSALVESAHDYRFTYGFAEARIKLPPSDGTLAPAGSCGPNWGVFLLNGRQHPDDGEIDVMECLSDDDVSWHYHHGTDADPRGVGGYPPAWRGDMPGSGGWHTFAVDWQPGRLVFYYDGVPVGSTEAGVTDRPHYLIAALAVSGSAVAAPQTMQVDYIRVWKRTDLGRTEQPGTEQGRTEQGRTEQGRTEQGRTEQGRTDLAAAPAD